MDPVSLAYIVGAVLIAALAVIWIAPWFHRRRDRLDGWWHQQKRPSTQKWNPGAWRQACDLSLERARERRR